MANSKEVLSRIKSIEDTMKITNAMYLISSSKLKKARKSLSDTLPFFQALQDTIAKILDHVPNMTHPYFDSGKENNQSEKKRGFIVVTADKGLAGAYNHNIIKIAEEKLAQGTDDVLFIVGEVGRRYFDKKDVNIDRKFNYSANNPNIQRARVMSRKIMSAYDNKQIDEIHIIYTKMVGSMKEEPEVLQLLPLKKGSFSDQAHDGYQALVEFDPSPEEVLTQIVPDYVLGIVLGALVESYSSEQNARMTAMQASTDNAKEMLRELRIEYNRVRQAAITQEITEIVGGARALKNKK
ncbi:ATP synthase F1 subunit gamma [Parasporobacterium paucivorans]|uniref:ATP synthase gamma chain n=1 Tax=Parasporobacterium paucivorans DSM 15970 TaxID=1122934 RepID=A0A1M6FM34_9FIRM|nr:ATP synthase F1 subunit gamma [Parasporobacterium paucivorans]SHI98669.1 F-type H+-transporting ATPase subunit gamma [Parasporobacterium paucivorans DSM 15970]